MKQLVRIAVATALLPAGQAGAENWADTPASREEFQASKELCRSVKGTAVPEEDRPDAAATKALKGCNSEALYYGIGMPADPVRARQCAFVELGGEGTPGASEHAFSGGVMLMTVYANGVGAERNLDLAMDFACNLEAAAYEHDGRVKHLAELKAMEWKGRDFSYCDDITSGYAQGVCSGHEARIAHHERARTLAALTEKWSAADKRAFTPLRKALDGFVEARGSHEVDLSGTARAAMAIGEEESLRADFTALLGELEQGKVLPGGAEELKAADAELNRVYQQVQKHPEDGDWGTVTKEGIKKTQKAWLKYRDAWGSFARIRYPSTSREALQLELTKKRTARLQDFLLP